MVSIIIPMFNAEKYIKQCLESVISQTYRDIEVIVINDGSIDHSESIVKDINKIDNRIQIYSQSNHGLINARKKGFELSTGERILFVDSDDWISSDLVENLIGCAERYDVDVVTSGFFMEFGHKSIMKYDSIAEGLYEGEVLENLKCKLFNTSDFFSFSIVPYLWNKLWKREVLRKSLFDADERITVGEDVAIGFPGLLESKKIYVIKKAYYHYRQSNTSMLRIQKNESFEFDNAKLLYHYLKDKFNFMRYESLIDNGLNRYFVNQLFTRSYRMLNDLFGSSGCFPFLNSISEPIIIYGAGAFGMAVFDYLSQIVTIKAWVDERYDILQELGYPVVSIDKVVVEPVDTIVVSIFNSKASFEVKETLVKRGINEQQIKLFDLTNKEENKVMNLAF